MNATETQSVYVCVWNMNGGPVPSDTTKELTDSIQEIINKAEAKTGARLLYSVVIAPRDGE